jgi:hypothetical protein
VLVAFLALVILLLLLVQDAKGNFVYWANAGQASIGRAKINGTGVNNAFIGGLTDVHGVAVDSKYIYWTQGFGASSSIGRANLDGSGANPNFIPSSAGVNFVLLTPTPGIAVTSTGLYWANAGTMIGHANADGTGPNGSLINAAPAEICGVAADQSFVYWLDDDSPETLGRAGLDGSNPDLNFVTGALTHCGIAADPSFLYWGTGSNGIGRVPIGGGIPNNDFIPNAVPVSNVPCGVAVNPQYVFWANTDTGSAPDFIGRANLNGSAPNPSFVAGPTDPCLPAAAPSNKVTVNSVTRKKKKGTAIINAKVPGPGQVTLTNTGTEDVNAVAASVKQVGLTITGASSFKLAVKPAGKTKKKLKKQLKRKGKAKVAVKAFVTFVPAGVAGVPNAQPVKTKLIQQRKRKKK